MDSRSQGGKYLKGVGRFLLTITVDDVNANDNAIEWLKRNQVASENKFVTTYLYMLDVVHTLSVS